MKHQRRSRPGRRQRRGAARRVQRVDREPVLVEIARRPRLDRGLFVANDADGRRAGPLALGEAVHVCRADDQGGAYDKLDGEDSLVIKGGWEEAGSVRGKRRQS